MIEARNQHPNEVVGAQLSQEALRGLAEFHAAWLAGRSGGRCAVLRECNLAGRDLSQMNFGEAVLIDCDFTGICARGARFTGATLHNARFDQADLTGADFDRADLSGASFLAAVLRDAVIDTGSTRPELRKLDPLRVADMVKWHGIWIASEGSEGIRADFSGADLSAIDLSGRNLCLADLSGAVLADTKLTGALLIAADFRDANLTRANLAEADLRGANFQGAHRRDADLSNSRIGAVPGLALTTRGL
jgi:uncharacterized protein YjbI with pentapeptide repeats